MRVTLRLVVCLLAVGQSACAHSNAERLPPAVRLCVKRVRALPAKPDGRPWDGPGTPNPNVAALMKSMAAASLGGGWAAAAGVVGAAAASAMIPKRAPDLQVRISLGGKQLLKTTAHKDSTLAVWQSECATINQRQYRQLLDVSVWDKDLRTDDPVGSTTFRGLPSEAIRSRIWKILGFDSVAELELTLEHLADHPVSQ